MLSTGMICDGEALCVNSKIKKLHDAIIYDFYDKIDVPSWGRYAKFIVYKLFVKVEKSTIIVWPSAPNCSQPK